MKTPEKTPEKRGASPENREKTNGLEEYLTSKINFKERHDIEENLDPVDRHIVHLIDGIRYGMGFEKSENFILKLEDDDNNKETNWEVYKKADSLIREYYEKMGFKIEKGSIIGCYIALKDDQEIHITMDAYGYPQSRVLITTEVAKKHKK